MLTNWCADNLCFPPLFLQAHQVVVDLAAATLSMLSQRPPAHEVMATAGVQT